MKTKLIATCPRGLSTLLAAEISGLGLPVFDTADNFVETEGSFADSQRMNLRLRTAHHVLYYLCEFECPSPEALYEGTRAFAWEEWLPVPGYFSIESDSDHESVRDTRFPNLRCKDAIADRLLEKRGARPDSGPGRTGAVIRLFWKAGHASIYLDTSGEPLCRRGYRKMPFKAPLQETLAAGILLSSHWKPEMALVNPMCGSGTLAVEAALIALNRAPGLLRNNFAFQHVLPFNGPAYKLLRDEISASAAAKPAASIIASDLSPEAVAAAKQNAKEAGVEEWIDFQTCDFADTPLPVPPGIIVMNPEYGMRLGDAAALETVYSRIGDFFKKKCAGYTGYVFTGNPELGKRVGLKTKRKIPFFNAKIECRLLEYELYEGSRKYA